LLGHRKKIAKFLMRTFACRSTFLYGVAVHAPCTCIEIKINIPTPVIPSVLEQVLPHVPPVSFSFTGGKQLQVVKYQCHEMCIYLKILRNKTGHFVLVLMILSFGFEVFE
jgi:hypothetical protein